MRRLADARAFGFASQELASKRPDLSAKAGLTIVQRAIGWALLIAFVFFLFTGTSITLAVSGAVLGIAFSLIILLRLMAAIAAMIPASAKPPARTPDSQLWTLTILIPSERRSCRRSRTDPLHRRTRLPGREARHQDPRGGRR